MLYLILFAITSILSFLLAPSIARHAVLFYLGTAVLCGASAIGANVALPGDLNQLNVLVFRRGALVGAMFTVVMLVGVLGADSKASKRMRPARGELSIIGCIFAAYHIACFLPTFAAQVAQGTVRANVAVSLAAAVALTLLMLLLGATSFKRVRKRMNPVVWRRIQRTSYAFFALMLIHAVAMLLPSAASGNVAALVSVGAYVAVGAAYVALRLRRKALERGRAAAS